MLASSRVRADSALAPWSASRLLLMLRAWNGDLESGVSPKPATLAGSGSMRAVMVTCSAAGIPNVTVISQVYYVDETHAALSFQFFSKTIRNVRENPRAYVRVWDMIGHASWVLQLEFQHSETEGPVFDAMDMQIEAIASTTGMSGIFKLRAADIYRVVSVERVPYPEWAAS